MLIIILAHVAVGLRMSLVLLAVMSLYSRVRDPQPTEQWLRWKSTAWTILALAVVIYSPVHAASLLGWRVPVLLGRAADLVATALACASFIILLGSRGLRRGLSPARVNRGVMANVIIALGMVGAAWISH